ncbi:MAG: GNAT family N-acetyltransferase [Sedimentisphaerales bacterium]|nr:GNAT family N-acetyltransferase [Sedimentisphaerales bacterium]
MPADTKCQTTPSEQKTIQFEIFDSFDRLKSWQPEWDAFMESLNCEIFLTFDWCRLWWKYYGDGRQLRIFVFRHQSAIVGIVPVFFEKIWLGPVFIRAGKIIGMDFTLATFSPPIKKDFLQEVTQKFLGSLARDYRWDTFHFGPISGIFDNFDVLLRLCREYIGKGYNIRDHSNVVQTYFMLNESWDSEISKKQLRIIRQKYKALPEALEDKDAPIALRFASAQDCEQVFGRFCDMHKKHWQKLGKPGHFGDFPGAGQFHSEMAREQIKHNRLRLLEVKKSDYILGYKYAYKFGEYFVEFLDARLEAKELNRASLGTIVFCEQLKNSFEDGVRCIDSLRGKYEHKLRMGGKMFPINNIFISSRRFWPSIRIRVFYGSAWLLNMLYYNIWYRRIAPRLPFKRRPLWRIWLRSNMFAKLA